MLIDPFPPHCSRTLWWNHNRRATTPRQEREIHRGSKQANRIWNFSSVTFPAVVFETWQTPFAFLGFLTPTFLSRLHWKNLPGQMLLKFQQHKPPWDLARWACISNNLPGHHGGGAAGLKTTFTEARPSRHPVFKINPSSFHTLAPTPKISLVSDSILKQSSAQIS